MVYRAYDPQLEREVALKVPQAATLEKPKAVERFLREAKAAARLSHPHIVPVYDVGRDGTQYYIASAYIEAQTLAEVIDEGRLDFRQTAQIVRDLAEALAYAHTSFFTSEAAERLADRLVEDAPEGISHVYLVSGGSEAIESALKLARQYVVEKGEPRRRHIIARRQSYHGNTLGALATGGDLGRRAPFRPLLIETHHIEPCFDDRFIRHGER